jgi:hypothetical protein
VRPLLNDSQTVAQRSDVKCYCSARKFSMLRTAQLLCMWREHRLDNYGALGSNVRVR